MNSRHKKFILEKLIPFVLREQGRGFGMDDWLMKNLEPGSVSEWDYLPRAVPKCGTIACIGGSIVALKKLSKQSYHHVGAQIGLTAEQSEVLFTGWREDEGWPKKYAQRYDTANTPYKKARVACALLREVVKTEGNCLITES